MGFMFGQPTVYVADFETTVDDDTTKQTKTEVWSAAIARLYSEDCHVFGNIQDMFDWLRKQNGQYKKIGFHNLKFDGQFIIDWLIKENYYFGYDSTMNPLSKYKLSNGQFVANISSKGQWYSIAVMYKGHLFEFFDTLKLLPFTLKKIGKDFGTKHQKLEMDYKGDHYANCPISKEEMDYIKNDVYVLKEALEIMYSQGHDKLTIGGCCLEEYKKIFGVNKTNSALWDKKFPNLAHMTLDETEYGSKTIDEYIRHSYRGGWCYQVKGKEGLHYKGVTADVNSLYPSVMHSESGSRYPVGQPHFWKGDIPQEALENNRYYFVRIRCRFEIKENYLPWIQIKGDVYYSGTECLTTSDFTYFNKKTGEFEKAYKIGDRVAKPTLTLTMLDYELLKMHYNVYDEEVLDGVWFESEIGIFDEYIDTWAEVKKTSKGALRQIAKLFLNNLYGKFSTSPDDGYKVPYLKEDGSIGFHTVIRSNLDKCVYIAIGSAITSYAKNFTIRTAQKNYHGLDKPGFIYADTDSIHCDISADELIDVPVHPTAFNHWKVECSWDEALFIRQKTYIEHVTHEDLEPVEKPFYSVKCAGLPDKCKKLFVRSMIGDLPTEEEIKNGKLTKDEIRFINTKRELSDFGVGIKIPGKLTPKHIEGGVVLVEGYYEMQ